MQLLRFTTESQNSLDDQQVEAYLEDNPNEYIKWNAILLGYATLDAHEIDDMTGAELSVVAYIGQKKKEMDESKANRGGLM